MGNLSDMFPKDPAVVIDTERHLRLCIAGWQLLEDIYGSLEGVLQVAETLKEPWEQVPDDLLHFLYAGLMDASRHSPLPVPALQGFRARGADCTQWRDAVLEAVRNFFPAKPPDKKFGRPWSWEWAAWFVMGVRGRPRSEFMDMTIREIVALAEGRGIDTGSDSEGATEERPKGRPVTPTDFGPDGKFRLRKDGDGA